MESKKPILGYWAIRGRAQVPRLLLAYVGQQFENRLYKSPEEWFGKDKQNLGLDFANLPYLIDGDFKITESNAISKYIINSSGKVDLLGKTIKDIAYVDEIVGVIDDMSSTALSLAFNPNFDTEKSKVFEEKIQGKADQLVKFLGSKDWLLGYLTWADFKLVEAIYYLQGIWPDHYKNYPTLSGIRERFNDLPAIKEYYASDSAMKGPFLPPTAKWH